MDITLMISAVVALAAGAVIGWLATKAHADQIRADLIEERRELDIELSAARQQLAQEAHWRSECELLNNSCVACTVLIPLWKPICVKSRPVWKRLNNTRKTKSVR